MRIRKFWGTENKFALHLQHCTISHALPPPPSTPPPPHHSSTTTYKASTNPCYVMVNLPLMMAVGSPGDCESHIHDGSNIKVGDDVDFERDDSIEAMPWRIGDS
ncbi:hypothetical protein RIF29_18612 [Crotalaria pallida]|uniref:Uncharacterized protein n=1 Tax=Crotalaria pallida TaxID=3830 RepID=A0AAN9I6Z3_CROPI